MLRMFRALGCIGLFAVGSAAFALNQRSFVSTAGNDANTCIVTAPCRNFNAAIAQTLDDGEIVVLSSGGYGTFAVSGKSISIFAPPGTYAGVTAFSGDAISVDVTGDRQVTIAGLTLNGLGAANGVHVTGASSQSSMKASRLLASGFAQNGFFGATPASYEVVDSEFRLNGASGLRIVMSGAGASQATIAHCLSYLNFSDGFEVGGSVSAVITDSIGSGNTFGFEAIGGSGIARVRLERCTAAFNQAGFVAANGSLIASRSASDSNVNGALADAGGSVALGDTWLTRNTVGLVTVNGGSLLSLGNNVVEFNNANGAFTGTFTVK